MQVLHSLDELHHVGEPVHLALGVFDGVHAGHRAVICSAVMHAREEGGKAGVLTFDEHPLQVVAPERAPKRLLAHARHKELLLAELGVDVLVSLPFNERLASMVADDFLRRLTTGLDLKSISVGSDWRFGKGRQADVDFLNAESKKLNFQVYIIDPVLNAEGKRISSTAIREAISQGRFDVAHALLGRDYTVLGKVIEGRRIGRTIGYPTANLLVYNEQLPPQGVYLVKCLLASGIQAYGVANLGCRPTFERERQKEQCFLEVHLLDWNGNLYGQELEVTFLVFLRTEQKFPGVEQLKEQIVVDESRAREFLSEILENKAQQL